MEHIQESMSQCMLFVNDVVLVLVSIEEINVKLELWRQTLEAHDFSLRGSKTKYIS